jgi:hypothetical protein
MARNMLESKTSSWRFAHVRTLCPSCRRGPIAAVNNQKMNHNDTTLGLPSHRPWLRFSLRGVLICIVIVAVLICIPINRANKQRSAVKKIQQLGGQVTYDFERTGKLEPSAPAWLRKLIGEDYFRTVDTVHLSNPEITDDDLDCLSGLPDVTYLSILSPKVTDAGLARLDALTNLTNLQIHGPNFTDAALAHVRQHPNLVAFYADNTKITDAGLAELAMLRNLRSLQLACSQITDAGLDHLQQLTGLLALNLDHTEITDAGLQKLAKLTSLQDLEVNDTQITNAGLQHLLSLQNLKFVGLNGTQTTREGIQQLRAQMPQLNIRRTFPALRALPAR